MFMRAVQGPFRTRGFGVFEVDLRAAELRKHGVRIKLQEQPFQILSLLLEHPGEVVTREELREKLWPAHTFVDFDRSLNKAMTKLRAALGDSADSPRYVETIPRHGYRFLAPVLPPSEAVHGNGAEAEFQRDPIASKGRNGAHQEGEGPARIVDLHTPSGKRRFYGLVAAVGIALVGVGIYLRVSQPVVLSGSSSAVNPRRSVAVLGFTNLSADPTEAWLSTAFSDWLTTELSAGGQLRTLPAESIARMKAELSLNDMDSLGRANLEQIHRNLGTDLVVAGSYASLATNPSRQIRLDVRLFDTQSGETLYADSETGSQENLFDLVSRAGEKLRANLGIRRITKEEAVEVATAIPSNAGAARLYAEGLSKVRVFDALSARDLLVKAIAAGPDYALSHAALATAWSQLGYDENAKVEAKKAFDLSSNLPRAERLLVEARYRETSHEWDKAIEIYRALFEFFPDNLDYGIALASVQVSGGRGNDAMVTLAHLRELPPPQRDDPRIDLEEDHAVESLGDFKSLLSSGMRAAEKAKSAGASLLQARALTDQGWALENLAAPDGVEAVVREAEQLYLAAHDQRGVAIAATEGGIALQMQGDYQGAKKQYEKCLAIYQKIGYRFGVANERDNFGDIYLALGDLAAARKSYEESLKTYTEIGHIDGEALAEAGLGEVFLRQGNTVESKRMLQESLEICRRIGDRSKEGTALSGMGQLMQIEGDTEAAWKDEIEAKAIFDKIGDKYQSARMQVHIAELLLDQDKNEEASVQAIEAAGLFEKTKADKDAAAAYLALSRALLAEGKLNEARNYVERTMATAQKSRNEELELFAAIAAARIHAALGKATDRNESMRQLRDVIARATTATFAGIALEARLALGEMEMNSANGAAGMLHLQALKKDAASGGFGLLARKADAALRTVREQAALHNN
jgi:DNA-binding winged helix-turn-helix (wHTH) protein/tetratricopeptide (TPR) repeat protein